MGYHCIVTAAARLAKESPEKFVARLGHDGTGTFPDSEVVRTHHMQEIIDGLLKVGIALCPIELVPTAIVSPTSRERFVIYFGEPGEVSGNFDRFKSHLKKNQGIITGTTRPINASATSSLVGHAVYWCGERCHDSRGSWKLWETEFEPSEFWRAVWM